MKYLRIIICVLLVCLLFTGCNFRMSSSIDELIYPLSPFGDNADIKKALDDYAKGGYSLKIPNSGKYITSYTFFDIDGNGDEEALAFYEPSDNLGTINMSVIKKTDDAWKVIQNIEGDGRDIHSLDFADINGDGVSELFVCWDAISNSSNHFLSVYQRSGKNKLNKIGDSITINNFIIADIVDDSVCELLLFEINSGNSSSAKAELYSLSDSSLVKLGETKLDSHITSYDTVKTEKVEGVTRVYADATGSDGESMLTEIVYWSDTYDTIVSPFYSYSTGLTQETKRKAMTESLDIDSDGRIDIPLDYPTGGLPKQISAIDWCVYKNTTLIHTAYSLLAQNDMYIAVIPDDIIDKISVGYDVSTHEMSVINKSSKKLIYSVMPVLKATYSEDKYPQYKKLTEASGYCYLVKQGDDGIKFSDAELQKYIKSVNQKISEQEE